MKTIYDYEKREILENCTGMSVDDYKKQLVAGDAPADHGSGIYNGAPYVIEYIV